MQSTDLCLCGSSTTWTQCCGRFLTLGAYPASVEALMRSRFSAYCLRDIPYLQKTWHPSSCPKLNHNHLDSTKWLRLDVISAQQGLKSGTVEFKAYFQTDAGEECLHEVSRFKKHKNRWVYLDGQY